MSLWGKQATPATATHYHSAGAYYGKTVHAYAYAGTKSAACIPFCGANPENVVEVPSQAGQQVTCRSCLQSIKAAQLQPLYRCPVCVGKGYGSNCSACTNTRLTTTPPNQC